MVVSLDDWPPTWLVRPLGEDVEVVLVVHQAEDVAERVDDGCRDEPLALLVIGACSVAPSASTRSTAASMSSTCQ